MKKNKSVCIANIGKPRGLKGEFFLNSFCSPKENILNYINDIFIENENKLSIEYIKKSNSKFLAKLKNIDSVDEIKKYTNIKLYISSENLPQLKSEEVYWHDLEGMIVIGLNKNEILGEVKELNNFGANDYLIVKPTPNSVDEKERLIPFIKEKFIDSIDKKERVLKVYWQSDY
jgi:16S rRNA processing protein RimM